MTYGGGCIYKASYQGHEIPSNDVLLDDGEEREFNLRASQISTLRIKIGSRCHFKMVKS
jgi:hypothetical protein